jgi:hypothetical protein
MWKRGGDKPVRLAEGAIVLQKEGGNHPSRPVSFFFKEKDLIFRKKILF